MVCENTLLKEQIEDLEQNDVCNFFVFSVIVHVMDKQGRNPFSVGQKNCFNNESFYDLLGLCGYITIRRFLQRQ